MRRTHASSDALGFGANLWAGWCILFASLCILLPGAAGQRVLSPVRGVQPPLVDSPMRVNVRLVLVPVTVLGADHRLSASDFAVFDNDQRQTVSVFDADPASPLSVVLAVDVSLSTATHLEQEKRAALDVVNNLLQPQDALELIAFDHDVTAETDFVSNRRVLSRAIARLRPGGATSLYDMIYLASRELAARSGRKALIIISDGGDTTSSINFQAALREAVRAETEIYSVIVIPIEGDAGRDIGGEHALQYLAEQSGGEIFAADAAHLGAPMSKVIAALRRQYLLGFYPRVSGPQAPGIHQIRVEVSYAGLTLLHRKRYYGD
jgi:Ca-activated chloride channel family protein